MKNKIVKAYAPATIANLTAGFDMLGVALDKPGDFVTAKRIDEGVFRFTVETTFADIPTTQEKNIAAQVALQMLDALKPAFGVEMILHKMMPVGSGMGSSGASSVAAAVAVNALFDQPLSKQDLLPFVIEGERKASGAAHADNVAPGLFGGACIIRNENPLDIIPFSVHEKITWIVIHPHLTVATSEARRVLPSTIALKEVTRQMGNVSGLVLGLIQGDAALIHRCLVDHIAEPLRESFIPGFSAVKAAAIAAGAVGCGISGSGPAIFAVTLQSEKAQIIANAMLAALSRTAQLPADVFISHTNAVGAQIIAEDAHAV